MNDTTFVETLLILNFIYTFLYLAIGAIMYKVFKPTIAWQQWVIISLALVNILLKDIGYSILWWKPFSDMSNNSIMQIFATLTSACFLISFQAMTVRLILERMKSEILVLGYQIMQTTQRQVSHSVNEHDSIVEDFLGQHHLSNGGWQHDQAKTNLSPEEAAALMMVIENTVQESSDSQNGRPQFLVLHRKRQILVKIFAIFFCIQLILIGAISYLTYVEVTMTFQKVKDTSIDQILAILGFVKFVIFDAPMFFLFIREHLRVQRAQKQTQADWNTLSFKEKRIIVILYSMIFLSLGVYLERIIANDILFKLMYFYQIFSGDTNSQEVIENIWDVHVMLVTNTDFIAGLLQLYLSYWFGQTNQGTDQDQQETMNQNHISQLNAIKANMRSTQLKSMITSDSSNGRATFDANIGTGGFAEVNNEELKQYQKIMKDQEDAMYEYEEEMGRNIDCFKNPRPYSRVIPTMETNQENLFNSGKA
ncbi:hypothetical protein FGO68_gene4490 [Halteria grandinella]|uniref:Uncharacterized protein n=1 Tax=Halteria grandinella TaxID=5974 RepID=A0A8J8NRW2_HALGN|nr:hypothetical protein FGO68_gene4490 [Halteria grandinella]